LIDYFGKETSISAVSQCTSIFSLQIYQFLLDNQLLSDINSQTHNEILVKLLRFGTVNQMRYFHGNGFPFNKKIIERYLLLIPILETSVEKIEYLLSFHPNVDAFPSSALHYSNFHRKFTFKQLSLHNFLSLFFKRDSKTLNAFRIFKLMCFETSELTPFESKLLKRERYSKTFIKYFCFIILPRANISLATPLPYLWNPPHFHQLSDDSIFSNPCPLIIRFISTNTSTDFFKKLLYFQTISNYSTKALISLLHFLIYERHPIEIINIILTHVGKSSLFKKYSTNILHLSMIIKYYEIIYSLSQYLHNFESCLDIPVIESIFYRTFTQKNFPSRKSTLLLPRLYL
jgi:hypothetical protein